MVQNIPTWSNMVKYDPNSSKKPPQWSGITRSHGLVFTVVPTRLSPKTLLDLHVDLYHPITHLLCPRCQLSGVRCQVFFCSLIIIFLYFFY